ncbi:MAG: hypothetical protein QXH20_02590 [Candidatus Bathyarchaeia archaeon]
MTIKKALKITATFAVLALLSIYIIQIRPVKGLPADSMWTEPDTITLEATTPIGFKFNITVYANLSVPTYTWQMYLIYNKAHLNATGCWYSAGAKSEWAGTRPTAPQTPSYGSHNTTHNYVLFGESLLGAAETPPGSYSLAFVEFEVIAVPPEGQVYQSQIRLDIVGVFNSFILDTDLNEIPLNFAGTTYTIDEFIVTMLLTALILTTASAVLLKNKLLKTKRI